MRNIKVPITCLKDRIKEFHDKFRQDINRSTETVIPKEGLIPAREVPFSLSYIQDSVNRGEDSLMFELIARGREVEDIESAAEEVVKIMEKQEFTIAETLLFLKLLEEMALASPLKY